MWREGQGLDYYVSAAGGLVQNANRKAISVRFANGEVRTKGRPRPGPGSEVFVPYKDPNAPHTDYVALFGAIAQILASTIAIIVVVRK